MLKAQQFPEPGRGVVFWWLDRLLVLVIVALILVLVKLPFFRVKVRGQKNIPHQGRVLVLANHPSYPGVFLTMYSFFWPWILRWMGMFPVNIGKEKYLKCLGPIRLILRHLRVIELPEKGQEGASQFRRGVVFREVQLLSGSSDGVLWLFGEGTRTPPDKHLAAFVPGVGRVVAEAIRAGGDFSIVFVWDQGSRDFWPKGRGIQLRLLFGRYWSYGRRFPVTVSISKPLSAQDHTTTFHRICHQGDPSEIGQAVASYLQKLFWAWAVAQHPELAYCDPPDEQAVAGDLWRL